MELYNQPKGQSLAALVCGRRLSCEIRPGYVRQLRFNKIDRPMQFNGILLLPFFRLKGGANDDLAPLSRQQQFRPVNLSIFTEILLVDRYFFSQILEESIKCESGGRPLIAHAAAGPTYVESTLFASLVDVRAQQRYRSWAASPQALAWDKAVRVPFGRFEPLLHFALALISETASLVDVPLEASGVSARRETIVFALCLPLCLFSAATIPEFIYCFVIAMAAAVEHESHETAADDQREERSQAKGKPALLAYHYVARGRPCRYGENARADQQR
jgi:hypothetical protein